MVHIVWIAITAATFMVGMHTQLRRRVSHLCRLAALGSPWQPSAALGSPCRGTDLLALISSQLKQRRLPAPPADSSARFSSFLVAVPARAFIVLVALDASALPLIG